MKLFFLIFTAIIFSNCVRETFFVQRLKLKENEFLKKIPMTEQMELVGSGGQLRYNIKTVDLDFRCHKKLYKSEVKNLVVKYASKFLEIVNGDNELMPYFENYPLTFENLRFSLTFVDENNDFYTEPNIAVAFTLNGDLCMYTYDPISDNLQKIYDEKCF